MQRRGGLWIFVVAVIVWAGTIASSAMAADRPNIILCMGDDHGWDETGYNGHPHLQTPILDEMASAGLRLDRFYSASPVCSPTRGSVMTGRHPNRYGTFSANWSIRPEEIGIAEILSTAGYACGHFGKWHLGPVKAGSPTNPGALGFDKWVSHDNFFEMNPFLSRNGGPPEQFEGESSLLVIEEAIRFIDQARQRDQPFFAVVWFGSPHEPYSGLEEDLALYSDLPESYKSQEVGVTGHETGERVRRPLHEVLQERYAEITAMDRALGHLRDHLEQTRLKSTTLVWYCGDNGVPSEGAITTPLRGSKGRVYEGGVRVPGVIEWPERIPEPRVSAVNTVTSDILPTLCDIVGAPLPDRPLDGISLVPLFEGTMTERPEPICFWSFDTSQAAVGEPEPYLPPEMQQGTTPLVKKMRGEFTRTFRNFHHPTIRENDFRGPRAILDNRFKLVIHDADDGQTTSELFDIREDPAEENDISEDRPKVASTLRKQLRDWQESVLNSLTGADY